MTTVLTTDRVTAPAATVPGPAEVERTAASMSQAGLSAMELISRALGLRLGLHEAPVAGFRSVHELPVEHLRFHLYRLDG